MSWKSAGDCMRNASKAPKIPYSSVVGKRKSDPESASGAGSPPKVNQFFWFIGQVLMKSVAVILVTDRTSDTVTDKPHWSYKVLTTLENMEISGNLLILENSGKTGNLKFTQGIYMILSLGHRVMCIIVSNSSVNWLGDTVTGVDRASHHAPSITYSVILQESCRTDC